MGASRKTVDMSVDIDEMEVKKKPRREKVDIQEKIDAKIEENEEQEEVRARVKHGRSKQYVSMRRHVDKTKLYTVAQAVELLSKTTYSNFVGTVSADLNLKETGTSVDIAFPHSTGQTRRVAVASDALLKKIEAGEIDFDVLVASPDMMPKLAKHARTLGPKGLMPNPKNGTIAPDAAKRAKELEGGKTTLKTERKHPLMHVVVGKADQKPAELVANVEHLIKIVGPRKIKRLTLSATMSPGVKVDVASYITA